MSTACSVCRHPDAPAIDQLLAQGVPYRQLAQRYTVSKSSLLRHTQHAVGQADHEPGHATDHETPRPPMEARVAQALRQDLDRFRRALEDDPRARATERPLLYTLTLLDRLLAALSASDRQH